ncbi:MAG: hypothetical protein AAB699_01460, partial [Patescibacteria group bacterium]
MKNARLLFLLAAGLGIQGNAAELSVSDEEFIAAVLDAATLLEKQTGRTKSAGVLLFSTELQLRPAALMRPQTNVVALATPSPIERGQAFTITIVPEPGHKVIGVALIIERTEPSPLPKDACNILFEQPPRPRQAPAPWKIGPKLELVSGTTESYRSAAPGPALWLRRKF